MNLYQIIGFMIVAIILGQLFHIGPAIEQLANGIANIPLFDDKGDKPFIFDLAVRMVYLITLVAIVKVVFGKSEG